MPVNGARRTGGGSQEKAGEEDEGGEVEMHVWGFGCWVRRYALIFGCMKGDIARMNVC